MFFKYSLAATTMIGLLAAMAACQASFHAGAGSGTTPSTSPAAGGVPAASQPVASPAAAGASAEASATAVSPDASAAVAAPSKVSLAGGKILVQGALAFDSGKPILLETAENSAILADMKLFLDQTPKVTQMRIEGHTDNAGAADANLALSGQRALAVKKVLLEKGIGKDRIIAVGFGDKKPIADNATDAGRAQNQRIEFRVATWNGKNYLNQAPNGGGTPVE